MANIKSAIKRAKQNAKRNILKSSQRSAVRTAVKSVENAVLKKDKKIASEALLEANKVLDRMAQEIKELDQAAGHKLLPYLRRRLARLQRCYRCIR